jgi:hypothetical protein
LVIIHHSSSITHYSPASGLLLFQYPAAYAAHTVLSKAFPWRQSASFDTLIANQSATFGKGDTILAREIAIPIGNKLFQDR